MDSGLIIRPSMDADLPAITEIYAWHVRHGAASFEIAPPDSSEMARRRSEVLRRRLPWLVADKEGEVAGYAYATPYRTRAAYRYTLEDSIYLDPAHTGKGIGSLLLARLIGLCEETGARQLIAVIGDGDRNAASIRLHQRFGFRHAGVLHAVGFKFGRWVDTVLMQRALGAGDRDLPAESAPTRGTHEAP